MQIFVSLSSSPTPGAVSPETWAIASAASQKKRPKAPFLCRRSALPLRARRLDALQPRCYLLAPHLAGGGARQIRLRPQHPAPHSLKLRQPHVGSLNDRGGLRRPDPRTASTAQGSGPAAVSMGTTAQAATPGSCSMAASRSSGCRLSPAAVTMTSLLRPRKRSSPVGSVPARSPVASHSVVRGCSAPPRPGGARRSWRPRTSTSPSGPSLTSRPASGLPMVPCGHVEGMVEGDQRGGFRHAVALHQHQARARSRTASSGPGSAPPPEMSAQNLRPKARCTSRKRHQRRERATPIVPARLLDALGQPGQRGFEVRLQQRVDARHGGQHGDALAADGFNKARRHQAAFKVQLGAEDVRHPQAHGLAEDVAQRQRVQNAQRMDQPLVAQVGLRGLSRWGRRWPARCRG